MDRLLRLFLSVCVVVVAAAATAEVAFADGKPTIETLHVDRIVFNDLASGACGFEIQDHEVGTIRTTTFPSGKIVFDQNETITSTNVATQKAVTYSFQLKVTGLTVEKLLDQGLKVTETSTFTGLNYRFPDGRIISAGRGTITATYTFDSNFRLVDFQIEDIATPKLQHLSFTLCQLLSGAPTGDSAIAGTVKDQATGKPISDICVIAWDRSSESFVNQTLTNSTGAYKITLLPAGEYKVLFAACVDGLYVPEWFKDKPSFETGDVVRVFPHRTTMKIDGALLPRGRVTGLVTSEATGNALSGVCVAVVGSGHFDNFGGITGLDGRYSIGGIPTGSYRVQFDPGCGDATSSPHAAEWWNDQPSADSANSLPVSVGNTVSGIDAALSLAGTISGTVTGDDTQLPLTGMCVEAGEFGFGLTDEEGHYTLYGLRPGTHKVHFSDCNFGGERYVGEWYGDVIDNSTTDDYAAATEVHVAPATDTAGIDASLAVGAVISGRVTDAGDGEPVHGACVFVWLLWQDGSIGATFAATGLDGTYRVTALPTGDYKVEFSDCLELYATEWWNGKATFDAADVLHVTTLGTETANVNAALHLVGGGVSGRVTDAVTGAPLSFFCVFAVDASTGAFEGAAVTAEDGTYRLGPLLTGTYKILFTDCFGDTGYQSQWYDGKPDLASATPVPVTEGALVRNINGALSQ